MKIVSRKDLLRFSAEANLGLMICGVSARFTLTFMAPLLLDIYM